MKNVIKILASLLFISLNSCSSDEPKNPESPGGSISENNSSVIIKADGTTSTGVVFSPIDNTSFFLDFIKYEIVDSHLEIIGYDPIELAEHVRPYASVTYQGVTYQTRVIRRAVFYNCNRLKSIEIPNTVISIEKAATGSYGAFEGCTNLTSVKLPEYLETIGWSTFCGCTGLTSISFPESLEIIGESAFYDCTSLTSISFPESLEIIGSYAFRGCTGLTSISFPESLEIIGSYAFRGCTGLTLVTCNAIVPPIVENLSFDNYTLNHGTLYVPSVSIQKYQNDPWWRYFQNIQGI